MQKETEWTCTDPDTQQYGRYLGDRVYEFKELNPIYTSGIDPYAAKLIELEVDLKEYTEEDILSIIVSYGYTLGSMNNDYGDGPYGADWIIAECIFEFESVNY